MPSNLTHALNLIDDAPTISEAKSRLRAAIRAAERHPPEVAGGTTRLRGRTFFDNLMEAILERVKQAVSREELVAFTLGTLAADSEACAASCYVCLDAEVDREGTIRELAVMDSALVHPRRLANFADRIGRLAGSRMFHDVMVGRESLEFLPSEHLSAFGYARDYAGLEDENKPLWICALPLPAADANHRARMLLVLYPAIGSRDQPSLPRGATQEWRALSLLRVAYEMLNHQLISTREQLRLQRRELLMDLAPGIVNHEIYQQVMAFGDAIGLMQWSVHELDPIIPEDCEAFASLIDGLHTVHDASVRLREISNAFNNLERRPGAAPVPVDVLLSEVFLLLGYVLAKHGIAEQIEITTNVELRADASLLEHVLLNVIANAVDAIADATSDSARPVVRVRVAREAETLLLDVLNNGLPITLTRPERIFERGFTTKPRGIGHGLGLYMCRLVMTYIGGTIDLIKRESLDEDMNVGFRIALSLSGVEASDLLDE